MIKENWRKDVLIARTRIIKMGKSLAFNVGPKRSSTTVKYEII